MEKQDLRPSDWLRVITNKYITADQIALVEGCDIRTARRIIDKVSGIKHEKGLPWQCLTDDYLKKIRGTNRKTELSYIFHERQP